MLGHMNRILLLALLILVSNSCSETKRFARDQYNLIIMPDYWTTIDFNTGVVVCDAYKFHSADTVEFSSDERRMIINSFYTNNIHSLKGEHLYTDPHPTMIDSPMILFRMYINEGTKRKADLSIDEDYDNKQNSPKNQLYMVVDFRNTILKVLEGNKNYLKARHPFDTYREKNSYLFMLI